MVHKIHKTKSVQPLKLQTDRKEISPKKRYAMVALNAVGQSHN
jgi:hypothetical protein